jgi:hypothetical protein
LGGNHTILMKKACLLLAILAVTLLPHSARCSTQWDWLAGTKWYVPAENLLAYLVSGTDFSNPLPVGDQTLWDLTASSGGMFSGTAVAYFNILGTPTSSTSTISAIATPEGQIRMILSQENGVQTVGIGQFRDVAGATQMEMQMMTGTGSAYVTHWAYMVQVPDPSFEPPTIYPPGTLLSQEWNWMRGTTWSLTAPGIFGSVDAAQFQVDDYVNGYFWGSGLAPDGQGTFTQIGSVTPEGNVLFNMVVNGEIVNLTGQITGDASNGAMALRGYTGTETFGDAATASVIPEPGILWLMAAAGCALILVAKRRRNLSA